MERRRYGEPAYSRLGSNGGSRGAYQQCNSVNTYLLGPPNLPLPLTVVLP